MNTLAAMLLIAASISPLTSKAHFRISTTTQQTVADSGTRGYFVYGSDDIYVRPNLSHDTFDFVVRHEIGHFFMQREDDFDVLADIRKKNIDAISGMLLASGSSTTTVNQLMNEIPPVKEFAANEFALWSVNPKLVTKQEAEIFTRAINTEPL